MTDTLEVVHDTAVLVCASDGAPVRSERDAMDLIGDAFGREAQWVAVPAGRFGDEFFALHTRVAGDIVQKFANYRLGLAVIGDISARTAESGALRDFVWESNRGSHLWFLPDLDALRTRLAPAS
ncbi:DUF4180 domain-containing protein [Yinghuangia soli]|uniref:DUF4180 domain-containing protein n=1 Tax=Yinghuangia soli TaxID=2908204 RepID=A0AA41Q5H1_9ACTN|nr:DUF4180 domain-containing protein [Yinghuangia soli]MCF2530754.1 DUF4180 domain-containing protein [Yinghuangia soli]